MLGGLGHRDSGEQEVYAVPVVGSRAVYLQGMSLEKIEIGFWNAHIILPILVFRNRCAFLIIISRTSGG